MTQNTTGVIIKNLRIKKGYTQNELADMLGVKLSTLQKYESGAILNIKLVTLKKLCEIFYIPPIMLVFPDTIDRNKLNIGNYMIKEFLGLNENGSKKVMEYAADLRKISEYTQ